VIILLLVGGRSIAFREVKTIVRFKSETTSNTGMNDAERPKSNGEGVLGSRNKFMLYKGTGVHSPGLHYALILLFL
jgi:hypothetical protein